MDSSQNHTEGKKVAKWYDTTVFVNKFQMHKHGIIFTYKHTGN